MINVFIVLINIVSSLGFCTMLIAGSVARLTVEGSHRHYQLATTVVTLFYPVLIASIFATLLAAMGGEMFTAAMDIVRIAISYYLWRQFVGADNWWNGRGKKMLDKIDKVIGKMTPLPAGAGA